jgi:nicotinate-nucleotide adenylyltransferase
MSKKIALFGGSFNPPHEGHYEIARRVARRPDIREVWVLPVYSHPFGKELAPFEERLGDCRSLFHPLLPQVKVLDLERKLGGTSWSVRLIQYLKDRYPESEFALVMGEDAFREQGSWKGFPTIKREASLIVFPRGGDSPIPDVSSTEIRKQHAKYS